MRFPASHLHSDMGWLGLRASTVCFYCEKVCCFWQNLIQPLIFDAESFHRTKNQHTVFPPTTGNLKWILFWTHPGLIKSYWWSTLCHKLCFYSHKAAIWPVLKSSHMRLFWLHSPHCTAMKCMFYSDISHLFSHVYTLVVNVESPSLVVTISLWRASWFYVDNTAAT